MERLARKAEKALDIQRTYRYGLIVMLVCGVRAMQYYRRNPYG